MQKIAFWRSIGFAYRFVLGNLGRLLRTGGPWLVLLITVGLIAFVHPSLLPSLASGSGMAPQAIAAIAFNILSIAGTIAFSVAWFRVIILDERRRWHTVLRFGRRELRCLGNGVLVCVGVGVPLFFGFYLLKLLFVPDFERILDIAGTLVLILVSTLIGWIPLSRLALAFPAIAVDADGEVLERAWRLSRGNGYRLYFGSILCTLIFAPLRWSVGLIFALLVGVAASVLPDGDAMAAAPYVRLLQAAGGYVLQFVELGVFVSYYAGIYRQLATADRSEGASIEPEPQMAV